MSVTDVTAQFPIPLEWPRQRLIRAWVDAITVHHTAIDPQEISQPGGALLFPAAEMTVEDELNHIAVIHLYHKSRGFGGFGYHFIVFPSGRAYLVTPLTQWGAHVAGENDHLWGLAFAGDFTLRLPGEAQVAGARECVWAAYAFGGREIPINPHLAYGGTTCPGRLVEILEQLRPKEEEEMPVFFRHPNGAIAIAGPHGKRILSADEWEAWKKAGAKYTQLTGDEFSAIPHIPVGSAGCQALTERQQREIVRGELDSTRLSG